MKTGKIILSAVIVWVVHMILIWLTCGWLFRWIYEIQPKIWLAPEIMMSAGNMIASAVISLIGAILFVLVYELIKKGIPSKKKSYVCKGMMYGFLIWLITAFVGMIGMPFYMTISTTVIIYWIVQALVFNLIKGSIIGAILK